jgi:pimeloyl-ACP methyl ester carboxylesterase
VSIRSQTHSIVAQGEALFVQESGQGTPLLFLHAGVADSRMWQAQVAAFAGSYRVICCDLRGYGHSPFPAGSFAYHEDVAALLDALAIDSAWIVGASFGGRVAVDFALTYPARTRGLILAAALVGGYQPQADLQQFSHQEDELLEAGDLDGATELNLRMWVDGPYRTPDQVDPVLRALVAEMQRHAFAMPVPDSVDLYAIEPPALERLQEIQVPTLIIVGELDVPEVVVAAQTLADRIPGARQIVMPGVAHLPSLEDPQTFNDHLRAFISSQANTS